MLVSITRVGTNKQTSLRMEINMLNFFSTTDHASSSDLSCQEFFLSSIALYKFKFIFFKVDSRPKNCIRMTNKIEKSCSVDLLACLVFIRHYNFFWRAYYLFIIYTLFVNKAKKLLPNHTRAAGLPTLI